MTEINIYNQCLSFDQVIDTFRDSKNAIRAGNVTDLMSAATDKYCNGTACHRCKLLRRYFNGAFLFLSECGTHENVPFRLDTTPVNYIYFVKGNKVSCDPFTLNVVLFSISDLDGYILMFGYICKNKGHLLYNDTYPLDVNTLQGYPELLRDLPQAPRSKPDTRIPLKSSTAYAIIFLIVRQLLALRPLKPNLNLFTIENLKFRLINGTDTFELPHANFKLESRIGLRMILPSESSFLYHGYTFVSFDSSDIMVNNLSSILSVHDGHFRILDVYKWESALRSHFINPEIAESWSLASLLVACMTESSFNSIVNYDFELKSIWNSLFHVEDRAHITALVNKEAHRENNGYLDRWRIASILQGIRIKMKSIDGLIASVYK